MADSAIAAAPQSTWNGVAISPPLSVAGAIITPLLTEGREEG
jgi:hypothetical protein